MVDWHEQCNRARLEIGRRVGAFLERRIWGKCRGCNDRKSRMLHFDRRRTRRMLVAKQCHCWQRTSREITWYKRKDLFRNPFECPCASPSGHSEPRWLKQPELTGSLESRQKQQAISVKRIVQFIRRIQCTSIVCIPSVSTKSSNIMSREYQAAPSYIDCRCPL